MPVANTLELEIKPSFLKSSSVETLNPQGKSKEGMAAKEWEQKWRNSVIDRRPNEIGQSKGPLVMYLSAETSEDYKEWTEKLSKAIS